MLQRSNATTSVPWNMKVMMDWEEKLSLFRAVPLQSILQQKPMTKTYFTSSFTPYLNFMYHSSIFIVLKNSVNANCSIFSPHKCLHVGRTHLHILMLTIFHMFIKTIFHTWITHIANFYSCCTVMRIASTRAIYKFKWISKFIWD